jgi:hypothetical protein
MYAFFRVADDPPGDIVEWPEVLFRGAPQGDHASRFEATEHPGDEAGGHIATPAQKIEAGFPPAEESRPEKANPSNQVGLDRSLQLRN